MAVLTPPKGSRPKIPTALRIAAKDLDEIDRRAEERGLNRTEYMIRASLGVLTDTGAITTEQRLDRFEQRTEERLRRLEDFAFGGD